MPKVPQVLKASFKYCGYHREREVFILTTSRENLTVIIEFVNFNSTC